MWELKSHPYLFGSGQVKWEVNKNHKAAVQCQPYFVITLLFHQTGHMGGGLQSFCIPLEERYTPHQVCPKYCRCRWYCSFLGPLQNVRGCHLPLSPWLTMRSTFLPPCNTDYLHFLEKLYFTEALEFIKSNFLVLQVWKLGPRKLKRTLLCVM